MNVYEEQVKIYDRRIKRIEENPDPKLLRSTKLFYEVERECCIDRLQAWKEDKPFVDGGIGISSLLTAMGFNHVDAVRLSQRTTQSAMLFDTLRAAGLPDYGCDIMTAPLAMYIEGALPMPALTVGDGATCDPSMLSANALGRMFNVPSFPLDVKVLPTYDAIRYYADQLRELIEFAESKVPGIKYDEDKLMELLEIDRQAFECVRDTYQVRKRVPCPIAGRDAFRAPQLPTRFTNPRKALEWHKAYRDELLERADKGVGAEAEEKLRFLWSVTAPFYANPFDYLGKRGVSIPLTVFPGTGREVIPKWGVPGGLLGPNGRLSPLEEVARRVHTSWGSIGRIWVDDIVYLCRDLKIDGLIYFQQVGCPTTLGLAKAVADAAEKELGIPTLHLEGRNIDAGSYNQQQFEARLGEFMDLCLARKGIA